MTALLSVADAVIASDTESRVTLMNPAAEVLTGWPAKEANGRPIAEVLRVVDEATGGPIPRPCPRAGDFPGFRVNGRSPKKAGSAPRKKRSFQEGRRIKKRHAIRPVPSALYP